MIKCVLNNTRTVLFYLLITKLKRNVIAVIASISSADSKAVTCSKSRKTKKKYYSLCIQVKRSELRKPGILRVHVLLQ